MPSQGPSAPAAPSAPEAIARSPVAPAPHRAAPLDARESALDGAAGAERTRLDEMCAAAVIPIGRPPAHPHPRHQRAGPPPAAPRTDAPPAPRGRPARRGDLGGRHAAGVLRLVRRTGAPVLPFPAATPAATPSRRPRPPPPVPASATPAVLRTALLVLFAAAAVALIGGRARADDRDAHQRRSAGSRLQPVRFTCDDSALQ